MRTFRSEVNYVLVLCRKAEDSACYFRQVTASPRSRKFCFYYASSTTCLGKRTHAAQSSLK